MRPDHVVHGRCGLLGRMPPPTVKLMNRRIGKNRYNARARAEYGGYEEGTVTVLGRAVEVQGL